MTDMNEYEKRLNEFHNDKFDLDLDLDKDYHDYEPRKTEDVLGDLFAEAEKSKPSISDLFDDPDELVEKLSEHEGIANILGESSETVQKTGDFFREFSEALSGSVGDSTDKKVKVIYAKDPQESSWLAEAEESMRDEENNCDAVVVLLGNEFRKVSDKKFSNIRAKRRTEEYAGWQLIKQVPEDAGSVSDSETAVKAALSRTLVISKK